MKTIAKAYLSNRECSVQEAVYHIPSELKLRRIFPANPPEERVKVLLTEKVLSQLPDDSQTFSKNQILIAIWKNQVQHSAMENILEDSAMENMLEYFCYAEFLACYTPENKSSKTCEYQPDELDDSLIENNHEECSYPPKIKLIISGETMRCCKVSDESFNIMCQINCYLQKNVLIMGRFSIPR